MINFSFYNGRNVFFLRSRIVLLHKAITFTFYHSSIGFLCHSGKNYPGKETNKEQRIVHYYQSSITRMRLRSSSERKGISIQPLPRLFNFSLTCVLNFEARSACIFCTWNDSGSGCLPSFFTGDRCRPRAISSSLRTDRPSWMISLWIYNCFVGSFIVMSARACPILTCPSRIEAWIVGGNFNSLR